MWISDTAVRRPVFAAVIALLLVAFGIVAFDRLPLREYPDIDPPVVSITTYYTGAAAEVVETRITQVIEERVAGIEGIRSLRSQSRDGVSLITLEFELDREVDAAANDVRDRVSRMLRELPEEADPPEVEKTEADEQVVMWLHLTSDDMDALELTDYARRHLVDRFSVLDGVARIQIGGEQVYAMRIWLDRNELTARELTAADVEDALRRENVELPAGTIRSDQREFVVRVARGYNAVEDFRQLVVDRGSDGHLVRLGEVAEVEVGAEDHRQLFRGNTVSMIGLGIVQQSGANTLEVTRAAVQLRDQLNEELPEGLSLEQSFDTSVFVQSAIQGVFATLLIAAVLVVLVIFLFLGDFRAMLVPAITVPVSLIATFMVLYFLGFTINLLTLLALVLAIGLVVDDSIVVLENIHRRLTAGESPLVASYRGARQVGFAVLATTAVLVAVFLPITFLQGDVGRLFGEFAAAMAAAVIFSSLVALTLSPAICSKLLNTEKLHHGLAGFVEGLLERMQRGYRAALSYTLRRPLFGVAAVIAALGMSFFLFERLPGEYAPPEDRGAFFLPIVAPEGSSFEYTTEHVLEIEERLMPLVERGEVQRLLVRAPSVFPPGENYNRALVIAVLAPWSSGRRDGWEIMAETRERVADVTGVRAFTIMPQSLGGHAQKPVQFVIGGDSYAQLAEWRDVLLDKAREHPGLRDVDHDYRETKPQLQVHIDRELAGDLGVSVREINRTLETLLGSRRATTFVMDGEEYDVILEGKPSEQRSPYDIDNIHVRSDGSDALIPLAALVSLEESAGATALNRYNRMRSITIEASLQEGYSLGEALDYLEQQVRDELPPGVQIDYRGASLDYKETGQEVYFIFALTLLVVFLVMAAQFESFIHPLVIMFTVPLAVAGALLGLFLCGQSLNIYSQVALIMLVGLATKNGILLVEFANQLRDEGYGFEEALLHASEYRLRPIVMTSITTIMGAVPLILAFGAGSESRFVIGVVVAFGVAVATLLTLFVVPLAYQWLARHTRSRNAVSVQLERELERHHNVV